MCETLGLNDIFWLDIEEAAGDKQIYASHRDWIEVVRQVQTSRACRPDALKKQSGAILDQLNKKARKGGRKKKAAD